MRTLKTGLLLVIVLVAAGCMTQNVGVAPSSTPITGKDTYTVIGGKTTGRAYGFLNIFMIPFALGESNPSKMATERAIRKGGGNAIIEATQSNSMIYLLLGYILTTRVDGTPVNIERGGGS